MPKNTRKVENSREKRTIKAPAYLQDYTTEATEGPKQKKMRREYTIHQTKTALFRAAEETHDQSHYYLGNPADIQRRPLCNLHYAIKQDS